MSFTVIIPARFASSRLPGKPLADIAGKPMIQHVFEKAQQSGASRVIIATDKEQVEKAAKAFGAEVCMTSEAHNSGTERLAEVVSKLGIADDEIIVNIQGDEPLIPPVIVSQVAENLAKFNVNMATLAVKIHEAEELFNPNAVKVVTDKDGYVFLTIVINLCNWRIPQRHNWPMRIFVISVFMLTVQALLSNMCNGHQHN